MSEKSPTRIEKHSPSAMLIAWNSGEIFAVPFTELRFQCPCAVCVDEHTGKRVIQREQVAADVKPSAVVPVGRYAVQISWSDGHGTGIYHFDTLHGICEKSGNRQ